jgi:TetR/AcrR family transcriptional regulator
MMDADGEKRRQILRAALAEFAQKGFRGATIKSIARAAGLQSPSLIYWYFPNKEELFQSVLAEHSPILRLALEPGDVLDLPPEALLPQIARSYLDTLSSPQTQQAARFLAQEAIQRPEVADILSQRLFLRVLDFLKGYLAHQVELGRLRPHDVRSSARAFIGMIIPYALSLLVAPLLRGDGLTADEHVASIVSLYLDGLRPHEPGSNE